MILRAWALGLCVCLLAGIPAAHAEAPDVRTVGISRKDDKLVASVGLEDLFRANDLERLLSGFSTRVLIRVVVVHDEDGDAVAQAMRLSEVVYDLWDEKLRVRISTEQAAKAETQVVSTPKAAVALAASLVQFPVAAMDKLQPGTYHLAIRADLNPISEELVTNVRRWLSRPSRGRPGSGDSFFGSFVSVFVNPRIDDSERQLQIVSQPFVPPKGSPR
jgi:hypothetical protein